MQMFKFSVVFNHGYTKEVYANYAEVVDGCFRFIANTAHVYVVPVSQIMSVMSVDAFEQAKNLYNEQAK